MRRPLSILALALVAGCSLVTSLDGLSGGPVPADDGGKDGASETGAPPPPPPSTDGGDGGPGIDASFCERQSPAPKICVDFADRLVLQNPGGSHDFETNSGPSASLDDAVFGDRPPSARFDVPPAAGEVCLKRTIDLAGLSPTHLTYGMSFRVDSNDALDIDLMEIRRGNGTIDNSLFFTVTGSIMALVAYDGADGGTLSATIPGAFTTGAWHRMVWSFDVAGGSIAITLDGATVLAGPADFVGASSPGTSTQLTFVAGTTDSTHAAKVWVDDVVIDY